MQLNIDFINLPPYSQFLLNGDRSADEFDRLTEQERYSGRIEAFRYLSKLLMETEEGFEEKSRLQQEIERIKQGLRKTDMNEVLFKLFMPTADSAEEKRKPKTKRKTKTKK